MQSILTDISHMNVGIRSKNSRCVPVSFSLHLHGGGTPLLILVIILPNTILYLCSNSTSYQKWRYRHTAPLACLSVPTCDVDRVGDGEPPQPLHSCWQSSHCPPLTSTVHFGGVMECVLIINPSNHNVDLNKVKYEHYQCLIITYILLSPPVSCTPMLFPPHSHLWQILHPALSVVPGTAPLFYIKFSEMSKLRASVTWTPWWVCAVLLLSGQSLPPLVWRRRHFKIFIDIEDVKD